MIRCFLSTLVLVCVLTLIAPGSTYGFSSEKSENRIESCKVKQVTYIEDEYEPEMIVELDNNLQLLSKCLCGFFYAGQSVDIYRDNDQLLILITYDRASTLFHLNCLIWLA